MTKVLKILFVALLFIGVNEGMALAQGRAVPGVIEVEQLHALDAQDSGAIVVESSRGVLGVEVHVELETEVRLDLPRNAVVRESRFFRHSLCLTPCRLELDRLEPSVTVHVGRLPLELDPRDTPQRWRVFPRRLGLQVVGRLSAVLGSVGGSFSALFLRGGIAARNDVFSDSRVSADRRVRGGAVGLSVGIAMLVGGIVLARYYRDRAERIE